MISCVSKDKAFYAEAAKYGISGPAFELIVHKYQDVSGDVESFPDSSFVNAQLGIGQTYSTSDQSVIDAWNRWYKEPLMLRSEKEVLSVMGNITKIFPSDAIHAYQDSKGNWILRINEPVYTPESYSDAVKIATPSADGIDYVYAYNRYREAQYYVGVAGEQYSNMFKEKNTNFSTDDKAAATAINSMWAAPKGTQFSFTVHGISAPVRVILSKVTDRQFSISDNAGLMTKEQAERVAEEMNDLSAKYHLGVYSAVQKSGVEGYLIQPYTKADDVYNRFYKSRIESAEAELASAKEALDAAREVLESRGLAADAVIGESKATEKTAKLYKTMADRVQEANVSTVGELLGVLTEFGSHPLIDAIRNSPAIGLLKDYRIQFTDKFEGKRYENADALTDWEAKTITFKREGRGSFGRDALHEIVHTLTSEYIYNNPDKLDRLHKIFESAKAQLKDKYDSLGQKVPEYYSMNNEREFLAELLVGAADGDRFMKELMQMEPIDDVVVKEGSLLHQVAKFIKGILKDIMPKNKSLYDNAVSALEGIINVQAYMKGIESAQTESKFDSRLNSFTTTSGPSVLSGIKISTGNMKGADNLWSTAVKALGGKSIVMLPADLTEADKLEGDSMINDAERTLKRGYPLSASASRTKEQAESINNNIRSMWYQIKSADAVYAIGAFSNGNVEGDTGYGVQMAADSNKLIYLYDTNDRQWMVKFPGTEWRTMPSAPALCENSACIGSADIADYMTNEDAEAGMNAILDAVYATIGAETNGPLALSPEIQRLYDKLESRRKQLSNLLEPQEGSKSYMTSTQVREGADSIINLMSDYVSMVLSDAELSNKAAYSSTEEWLDNCEISTACRYLGIPAFDPTGMTRIQLINKIGIDNLMKYIANQKFRSADWNGTVRHRAKLLRDNLDGVLYLAANTFAINEWAHLTVASEGNMVEEGLSLRDTGEELNQAKDAETVAEMEGSLLEKWQVDSRCEDVFTHMSEVVKNQLSSLYMLDSNGDRMLNSWGVYSRVNQHDAAKQILFWGQGSLTLGDLVDKLKGKVKDNPWVQQLIDKLDVDAIMARGENPGAYSDLQNSFFSVFNRHFQLYGVTIVSNEGGKTKVSSKLVNERNALKGIINDMKSATELDTHPLYTKTNGLNQHTASNILNTVQGIKAIQESIRKVGVNKLSAGEHSALLSNLKELSSNLGYPVDMSLLESLTGKEKLDMIKDAVYISENIIANMNNPEYNPFTKEGIISNLRSFLAPITKNLEALGDSAVFNNGKMYQSLVIPSYMTKLMTKFSNPDQAAFDEFLHNEYGQYDWFRDTSKTSGGWRAPWLAVLSSNPDIRKEFKHSVELNYDHKAYMKEMSGSDYIMSFLSHFFSDGAGYGKKNSYAWYRIPIMSNKPSSEWIRFSCDVGNDYKDVLTFKLSTVFNQELSRIQTVRLRNKSKDDPQHIKNFDTNGRRFCFLDYLNGYIDKEGRHDYIKDDAGNPDAADNARLAELIDKAVNMQEFSNVELIDLAKKAIRGYMDEKVSGILKDYQDRGIHNLAKHIDGITAGKGYEDNVSKAIWNDAFAAIQILQMTVSDIAFYKDMEDLQKRLAQIHAPGVRCNPEAVDYNGNRVSDGYFRTFYLTDFDKVKSNIISNVDIVFKRRLDALKKKGVSDSEIAMHKDLYKNILDGFHKINVADAQGYSSPTSYRKKAFTFGMWSKEAEDIYQKLQSGTYTYHDLQTAFQPLKPFVYTQISKPSNIVGLPKGKTPPLKNLKVGVQNKNSEYLLIMADAILQGEDTGQPNLLRAIFETMEESQRNDPTRGIDTVQFESTVKAGLMGRMDINHFMTDPAMKEMVSIEVNGRTVQRMRGEVEAKNFMMSRLMNHDNTYNSTFVHELPAEDYSIQQEVPAHFRDHAQQWGSQIRMIIPSDLEYTDYMGNTVEYTFTDSNGNTKSLGAEEFRKEYENTAAENIRESIDLLRKEFHLDAFNPIERRIVISKILQNEILSSPRYGLDMFLACSIDPKTGDFRVPLGDPIQANRVEQMLNSIIKKRVNKQEVSGGPVVQVTNFGTSRKLNIRFKSKELDADGKPKQLDTFEEFAAKFVPKISASPAEINKLANEIMRKEKLGFKAAQDEAKRRLITGNDVEEAYREYIRDKQAGIDYFEVFAPAVSRDIAEKFMDKNGTIDIAAINAVSPEILQMIGYRIPTEDKYSCAPIRIVGFLPREAGEGIMLPYEITLLTGSDFDVDKEYLMRKNINVLRRRTVNITYDMSKDAALSDYKPKKEAYEVSKEEKDRIIADEKAKGEHFGKSKGEVNQSIRERIGELYAQKRFQAFEPFDDILEEFADNAEYYRDSKNTHLDGIPIDILWKLYKKYAYEARRPKKGKFSRDNKLFDMSWAVLTHETTADKMLNPGGFEGIKEIAYAVEAYKNSNDSWDELSSLPADAAKTRLPKAGNLGFIDSQVQFYEQNSAASATLGACAVQKIAHAVFENNGYVVNVPELVQDVERFIICGKEFSGKMEFDRTFDDNGEYIGRVLGSHVAASADAAKEPCMNYLNLTINTLPVYSTMVRLGLPYKKAALFMAQPVMGDVLREYQKINLTDFTTIDNVVDDMLTKLKKKYGSSRLNEEALTEEELISNLRKNSPETDYKVLLNYSRLSAIAQAIKGPSFITRFNSIINATGPMIADNIVTMHKSDYNTDGLYTRDGRILDTHVIRRDHPILDSFMDAYRVSEDLMSDFPSYSEGFNNILNTVAGTTLERILNNRDMLNNLKDFYLSHALVDNNVVDESKVRYYVNQFADDFINRGYKASHPDNELIQSIRVRKDSETGKSYLEIPMTGMAQERKDRLTAAWQDLYTEDKELALDLFHYNFFNGGIGYSPRTFMNILPVSMREKIRGYLDTYRRLDNVSHPKVVLEQWLEHNTDDTRLFPSVKLESNARLSFVPNIVQIDSADGVPILGMIIPKSVKNLTSTMSFRFTDAGGNVHYMAREYNMEGSTVFRELTPRGGNGRFLELTKERNFAGSIAASENARNQALSAVRNRTVTDMDAEYTDPETITQNLSPEEERSWCVTVSRGIANELFGGSMKSAQKYVHNIKTYMQESKSYLYTPGIRNILKSALANQGIEFNEQEFIDRLEELC